MSRASSRSQQGSPLAQRAQGEGSLSYRTNELDAVDASLRHRRVSVNGVSLHYVEGGTGPGVVLLHGFPDAWFTWRAILPDLIRAGYRVIAPDLRGYNLSDKPRRVADYEIDILLEDVEQLVQVLDLDRAFLIGHDFGGSLAWRLAHRNPAFLQGAAILNAPHPLALRRHLRRSLRQLLRSWYIYFFQVPRLPERVLRASNYGLLVKTVFPGQRHMPNCADAALYREAWSRPGALTGMVNWYRAVFRASATRESATWTQGSVEVPVTLLWGTGDPYFDARLARDSLEFCREGSLHLIDGAAHWVHRDARSEVSRLLVAALARRGRSSKPSMPSLDGGQRRSR